MHNTGIFAQWASPMKPLGAFHIIGILLAISGAVLGSLYGSRVLAKKGDKERERFILIAWIIFLAQELARTVFLFAATGSYEWSKFPFQICGMVLFLIPVYKLIRNKACKLGLLGFISFHSFLGGAAYFVKPTAALYAKYVYISCDSFFWHICLCFFCTVLMSSFKLYGEKGRKAMWGGLATMAVCTVIAVAFNTLFNAIAPQLEIDFFYINQNNPPFYPVLNLVFKTVHPYPVYLIGFLIYFGLGGAIVYGGYEGIHHLASRKKA